MNVRPVLAVAAVAIVCGGVAGRLAADTAGPDHAGTVAATTPAVQTGQPAPAAVYRADAPGVVTVTDAAKAPASSVPFLPQSQQKVEQLGSGFVIDTKGDVVTNDHVVAGGTDVRVGFNTGHSYSAKVIGTDPASDIAVLRVAAPQSALHPLPFGISARTQVGQPVYAIGNPFGLDESMTAGIVSAVGRDIQAPDGFTIPGAIQTDTAINHGNSGGPLLDSQGHVVGVTSQIQGGTVDANVGVGFAVPGDTARSVAQQLIAHGVAAHAWLGVRAQTTASGVKVADVTAGSPAAKAGLKGATIVAIDGKAVHTSADLADAVAARNPGDRITLQIVRGSARSTVTITLGDVPATT